MIKEYEFTYLYLLLVWGSYMQSASKMPEEYTCLIDAVILWPVLSKPCTELRKMPGQRISLARGGELLKIVEISLKN